MKNWKYYLQFVLPMRFENKTSGPFKQTWWMWGGKCFNIKFGDEKA